LNFNKFPSSDFRVHWNARNSELEKTNSEMTTSEQLPRLVECQRSFVQCFDTVGWSKWIARIPKASLLARVERGNWETPVNPGSFGKQIWCSCLTSVALNRSDRVSCRKSATELVACKWTRETTWRCHFHIFPIFFNSISLIQAPWPNGMREETFT